MHNLVLCSQLFLHAKLHACGCLLFVICQIVPICIWCFFVASISKFSRAVAQMRGQGTLILVVVGSFPPAKISPRGSGGEVVTSPPLNRKVGCSRPTMIRARCLRVKQHYPAQKNNQKNCL